MTTAETTLGVATTPKPPYYSVTTTTELRPEFDQDAHLKWGASLYRQAMAIPGFIGLESGYFGRVSIAVSYWKDLDAIDTWRRHPSHKAAKEKAKAEWFGPTITRIARVEADYGFNLDGSNPCI